MITTLYDGNAASEPNGRATDLLQEAIQYTRAGVRVVPIPHGTKAPILRDWPSLDLGEADLPAHFPPDFPANIGAILGRRSGGLVDADLDCPEALVTAGRFLPMTERVSGRASAPESHRWYRCDETPKSQQFRDIDGAMILELRSDGAQTLLPPSTHPSGEIVFWHKSGASVRVKAADLVRAASLTAAAALIARHWPATGSRHDASLALAGGLLRAKWSVEQVEEFIVAISDAAGDEEGRRRMRNVSSAARRLGDGGTQTGWPRAAQLLGRDGEEVVKLVRKWLGISETAAVASGSACIPSIRTLEPYRPFPIDALPAPLAEFVSQSALALGCDPAYVALPTLSAIASTIGNARTIRLKRGWDEPVNVWTAIVGDSGTLKSPAYLKAVSHLFRIQKRLLDEHRAKVAAYQEDLLEYRTRKKAPKEDGSEPGAPPEAPVLRRVVCSDCTIEKLAEILADNPRGILVARDELAGWLGSFSRYKSTAGGSDLPNWLEIFRAGIIVVDRKTGERRTLYVPRASTSIAGSIQPSVLARALTAEFLDSGLAARILMAMPPKVAKSWSEVEVEPQVESAYHDVLDKLLGLDFEDHDGERVPYVLTLSKDAKCEWIAFYDEWAKEQAAAEGELAAALSKLEAYAARFSLIHHVVSHLAVESDDRRPVGTKSVQAGITLVRWFADEARRIYATLSESTEERDIRRLADWIRGRGGRVTARQLQKSNSRKYPTSEAARLALEVLISAGMGKWDQAVRDAKGGQPATYFVLHPTPDTTDSTPEDDPDEPDDGPPPAPDTTPDRTLPTRIISSDNEGSVGSVGRRTGLTEIESEAAGTIQELEGGDGQGRVVSDAFSLITDPADLPGIASAIEESAVVAIDTETTGLDPRADRVRLLSLSVDTTDSGRFSYLVDCFAVDPSPLFPALSAAKLIAHNAGFDLAFLSHLGFQPGQVRDTMLLSQVLHASARSKGVAFVRHGLKDCVERELGKVLDKELQKSNWSGPLSHEQLTYAADDVTLLAPLHETLTAKLEEARLTEAADIECRALPCVVWIAGNGVPFDRDHWQALADIAKADVIRIKAELDAAAPESTDGLFAAAWNWDSPEQVKLALEVIGHKVDSTGDDVLAGINHPVASLLRDYRDATKRETTYGVEWARKHVADDGRIYAGWKQLGANSGRMACGDPNLQNVKRGAYRLAFAAPPGRVLIKADYSQIELRIAAKITGDKALLAAYQRGDDLHNLTAKSVLGVTDVTKAHRQLAKAVNFGLLYGMGAKAFRIYAKSNYGVELTEAEAGKYRDAFFLAYPGLRKWHRSMGDKPISTRTLVGRRVLRVDRFSEKLNLPVQGTGADGLKLALALLWERRAECPSAVPVLAVHDEIVLEVPEADAADASEWLKRCMVDAIAPLIDPVPVEVEAKVGRTWGGD